MELIEEYKGTIQKDHAAFARQWLIDNGHADDFEVVVAKDNELFLDFDQTILPHQFNITLGILAQVLAVNGEPVVPPYEVSLSKSGNLHVVVTLPSYSMNIATRIAWQACFGADPKSNALQLLSVHLHELNPILLYQRKKKPLLLSEGDNGDGQPDKS